MGFDLIRVCVFGLTDSARLAAIRSPDFGETVARGFEVEGYGDDAVLARVLVERRPQVIVSVGPVARFARLNAAPIEVRRRWLHFEDAGVDGGVVGERIMATFIANATAARFPDVPLVSVFTPTHKTGAKIRRPWESLLAQTYTNWEWVVLDDSPDDGATFAEVAELAKCDARVRVFRGHEACGVIGEVKRRACGLCRGEVLVELDHDDELTRECLAWIVGAFAAFPQAGFAYTDCAETHDDGRRVAYDPGWGFGFGSYRREAYGGQEYMVAGSPSLNAKTMRHIVGVPNHARAWRRSAYLAAGGHSPEVHVADDYELLVRTFLTTRMVHIPRLGYIQYYNAAGGNTQLRRNAEIQRIVKYVAHAYNERIHARLLELGVSDFIWRGDGRLDWDAADPHAGLNCELVYRG